MLVGLTCFAGDRGVIANGECDELALLILNRKFHVVGVVLATNAVAITVFRLVNGVSLRQEHVHRST